MDSVDPVTDGWVRWITQAEYLVYSTEGSCKSQGLAVVTVIVLLN